MDITNLIAQCLYVAVTEYSCSIDEMTRDEWRAYQILHNAAYSEAV